MEKELVLKCTLYKNIYDQNGVEFSLYQWLDNIKNGADVNLVMEARKYYQEGNEAKVAEIKRSLPTIVPTGYMPDGRKSTDRIFLNRVCWVDVDIHDAEWSLAAMKKLVGKKGIIASYRTIRGGLRVFILMPDTLTLTNFKLMQQVILQDVDLFLGCEHDTQCEPICHVCSSSYDPETYITPIDELEPYPYEELLEKNKKEVKGLLKFVDKEVEQVNERKKNGSFVPRESDDVTYFDEMTTHLHLQYTKTQVNEHFERFQGRYPFERGCRHKNLLHLGQYAHFMRYNLTELEYIITLAESAIFDKEFDRKHVSSCVYWGYQNNKNQIDLTKFAKQELLVGPWGRQDRKSQKCQVSSPIDGPETQYDYDADFEENYNQVTELGCPFFPESVYENLHPLFKKILNKFTSRREKDPVLGSLLAVFSAALPKVLVRCKRKNYSPHLFVFCIGPSGSGKGVADKPSQLLIPLQERMMEENAITREVYERDSLRWNAEVRRAGKEGRDPDWTLKPKEPPRMRAIIMEANTSKSQFIIRMADNPDGLFLACSEISVIVSSIKSDAGRYLGFFNSTAMNEKIGFDYKNSIKPVKIDFPKLAMSAQGTLSQYTAFVGNDHEGLESRALTLLTSNNADYMNWSDADESESPEEFDKVYREVSDELMKIYDFLKESPTQVFVPQELRLHCDRTFRLYTKRLKEEKRSYMEAIIRRAPIAVARIASIFVALRKYDMNLHTQVMEATEEEVRIALEIVKVFIRHTVIAASMIVPNTHKLNKVTNVFYAESLYQMLPDVFTSHKVEDLLEEKFQMSRSTAFRLIRQWQEDNMVVKTRKGEYRKTHKALI